MDVMLLVVNQLPEGSVYGSVLRGCKGACVSGWSIFDDLFQRSAGVGVRTVPAEGWVEAVIAGWQAMRGSYRIAGALRTGGR